MSVEHHQEQVLLGGEMRVERALRVAGLGGDAVDRGAVYAELADRARSRAKQRGAGLLAALQPGRAGGAAPAGAVRSGAQTGLGSGADSDSTLGADSASASGACAPATGQRPTSTSASCRGVSVIARR